MGVHVPLEPSPPITSILPSILRSGGGPAFLGLPTKHTTSTFNNNYEKNWIIGLCNSSVFIGLAIMVYEQLYHALQIW